MIRIENLTVTYGNVVALKDINLNINDGEFVVVIGPSGAGKSTLLRCLNGLIKPSKGKISVNGIEVTGANGEELRKLRCNIGIIFQQFNLVKRLSVMTNILCGRLGYANELPSLLGHFSKEDKELATKSLARVGLEDKTYQRADTLSGGEQQRVAIARALVQNPSVILADEPMASLDHRLAHLIMDILKRINEEDGITMLVTLHVLELALQYGQRLVALNKGAVVYDGVPKNLTPKLLEKIYGGVVDYEV